MANGDGRWVKGLIHLHSKHSDGARTIGQLADMARRRGYRYMVMTDHADMIRPECMGTYVHDCREASDPAFLVIPGLEISAAWGHRTGQDRSTAHTLAIGIDKEVGLFTGAHPDKLPVLFEPPRSAVTVEAIQSAVQGTDIVLAAAHQFQHSPLTTNLSQLLLGSDYRYDMEVIADSAGIDFYYRTLLELDHEPEDLALYTGMTARWLAAAESDAPLPLPWAYTGSDFHTAPVGLGPVSRWLAKVPWLEKFAVPVEQLSHTTWTYLTGEVNEDSILRALRRRRTCATRGRDNVVHLSSIRPLPGLTRAGQPPGHQAAKITVHVEFTRKTTRPMYVHVYRDGVEVSAFYETYSKGKGEIRLSWELPAPDGEAHVYVVVLSGKLVTSPILIR